MKNVNIIRIFISILFISCSSNKTDKTKNSNEVISCPKQEMADTVLIGRFTGAVIIFHPQDPHMSQRTLWLSDSTGDTISFDILSSATNRETQNVVEEKLTPGKCVTVTYETEIIEEESVELARIYTARRLDYP